MSKDVKKMTFKGRVHINPKRGMVSINSLSPAVVMKKIKLRKSDGQGQISLTDFLPEVVDSDEDLEAEIPENQCVQEPSKSNIDDFSFINTQTEEELNAHIQRCLEMSSENKITFKNAFALQLIDCMSFVMQKKKDFSAMACTLDAGAKIYSYRVDALHHQVMKLADEVLLNSKQKRNDNDGTNDEKDEIGNVSKSSNNRKNSKKNILASAETLDRKLKGKDPRENYIKLDAIPGAIISSARRDAKDLSLSLELNTPFWPNKESKPLKAEGMVFLPEIKIYRDKHLAECVPNAPDLLQNLTTVSNFYDVNASNMPLPELSLDNDSNVNVLIDDPILEEDSFSNSFEDQVESEVGINHNLVTADEEVGVISTAMGRLKMEAEASGAVNKTPSRLDAMRMLFDTVSDYDYLNIKNVNYWAGPEFWKRAQGRAGSVTEKRKSTKKRKEHGEIIYEFEGIENKLKRILKKEYKLKQRTLHNWKAKKNTLPADLKVDVSLFIDLFHMSTPRKEEVSSQPSELTEQVLSNPDSSYSLDMEHSSQETMNITYSQDHLNTSFYGGVPGNGNSSSSEDRDPLNSAFYDVGLIQAKPNQDILARSSGKIIRVEVTSTKTKDFGESSMVPAPKIVRFQPIKYSTRPIRVDMQHLKQSMMGLINFEIEQDMTKNQSCSSSDIAVAGYNAPEAKFSDILQKLPTSLEKRTAEDMSPAIAFMALLTLANENNLQLENSGNYTDVVIKHEDALAPLSSSDDPEKFPTDI